jgi:tRNA threonylcarbamoyl adenosine modification protein (Sua5/YciO/YrdC/YwlC family)
MQLLRIHPEDPPRRLLHQVVTVLRQGGVIIYPTDTVYGLGCDITNKKAVHQICRIKGFEPGKQYLTCVCENLKIIGSYARHVSTPVYKMMRQAIPGPYTFVLQASKEIPKHFQAKKTVGIRVPDHKIPIQLVEMLGNPIASISLPDHEDPAYFTDPELIVEQYGHQVDLVIDGGYGGFEPSSVIDCSQGEDAIEVIREGAGDLAKLGLELG